MAFDRSLCDDLLAGVNAKPVSDSFEQLMIGLKYSLSSLSELESTSSSRSKFKFEFSLSLESCSNESDEIACRWLMNEFSLSESGSESCWL